MAHDIKQVKPDSELSDMEKYAVELSFHLHSFHGGADWPDIWYDQKYDLDCALEQLGIIEISNNGNAFNKCKPTTTPQEKNSE